MSPARLARDLKKAAKQLARSGEESYMRALERLSKEAGFRGWNHLAGAVEEDRRRLATEIALPIDPELPDAFERTPHHLRSSVEINEWWRKPFVESRPSGRLEVRCLDGSNPIGSTIYGEASSMREAFELAMRKLNRGSGMPRPSQRTNRSARAGNAPRVAE